VNFVGVDAFGVGGDVICLGRGSIFIGADISVSARDSIFADPDSFAPAAEGGDRERPKRRAGTGFHPPGDNSSASGSLFGTCESPLAFEKAPARWRRPRSRASSSPAPS
jgi:hypothetical protein